jgi:glycosyltransferase involved in cell wall biosynthesis
LRSASMTAASRMIRAPRSNDEVALDAPPTFSVVIAAHNAAGSISEAVESALTQTLPPLELIVSDDGSMDSTETALAPHRDRITYVRKEHGGVASARNAALEVAQGEFFAVLDADDVYLPTRLEALGELAMARPDLDILCTDAFLEHEGRVVGTFSEVCPFEVVDQRAAILERCFCAWPAVRRTTLISTGAFDQSLRTGSDWECAIRLLYSGAAAGLVDEPLYSYRVHERSLTADRVRTLNDRVAFLERAGVSYELSGTERTALARSLRAQRASLVLTEAEAALRARAPDARSRALAAARTPGISPRSRIAAVAAVIAPRTAARALARSGHSRLGRSVPGP